MSAKKRSFLCKIVHKLTENARFFAQKPHFLHIFAGGRDDFLAGPKTGFLGVRGVAPVAARAHFLCHVSRGTKRPTATFLVEKFKNIVTAKECSSNAPSPIEDNCVQLATFGACRRDGVLFTILII